MIDTDVNFLYNLEKVLVTSFQDLRVVARCNRNFEAIKAIRSHLPDILFMNIDSSVKSGKVPDGFLQFPHETIYTASSFEFASRAIADGASGYLVKPLNVKEVVSTVRYCIYHRLHSQLMEKDRTREAKRLNCGQLISIPALDGCEFLFPDEIIRCEGLQKCTRIITTERSDIISSYSIGVFRELLEDFGFMLTHKSHLINMKYSKKYHRDGIIYLRDNSSVPLSHVNIPNVRLYSSSTRINKMGI